MIECALLMLVLVPLMVGIPMIGKLVDLRQTTQQAVRYAAWESTVYKEAGPQNLVPAGVKARFFGDAHNSLKSVPSDPGVNALWGENVSDDKSGWLADTQVEISQNSIAALPYIRDISNPTVALFIGQQAGNSGKFLSGLRGNSWDLSPDGLLRAGVEVGVKNNRWLLSSKDHCGSSGIFGCVKSSSVILTDGWSSSSDDQARRRVRSLMPASALEPLGNVVSMVGHLPVFKELKKLDGAFGHVDMTVLPAYAQP